MDSQASKVAFRHRFLIFPILLFLVFNLNACLPALDFNFPFGNNDVADIHDEVPEGIQPVVLHKSESCGHIEEYIVDSWVKTFLEKPYFCKFCGMQYMDVTADLGHRLPSIPPPMPMPAPMPAPLSGAAAHGASTGFAPASANLQEAGVDEADFVKADSQGNLFVINGHRLVILQGLPAKELQILSSVSLDKSGSQAAGHVTGLYLEPTSHRAIVVTQTKYYPEAKKVSITGLIHANHDGAMQEPDIKIELIAIDVTDVGAPKIVERASFDGMHIATRRVGGNVSLVSQTDIPLPLILKSNEDFMQLVEQYRNALEVRRLFDYEDQRNGGKTSQQDEDFKTLKESTEAITKRLEGDLRDEIAAAVQAQGIETFLPQMTSNIGDGHTHKLVNCSDVYIPDVNLTPPVLLTVTNYKIEDGSHSAASIFANGNTVYASEQNLYVSQPNYGWWHASTEQQTVIHQFSIDGDGPDYRGSGNVPGLINDVFSFSEHEGYLRVATNQENFSQTGRPGLNNFLSILDIEDENLSIVGQVKDFGKNERIMSSRFVEDKAFIVTYRNIDPLFAIDLSQPTQPIIIGELKIPGFSSYIHPLDESHLLTIGRSGIDPAEGLRMDAMELQLFDVSDLANPIRLHNLTIGEENSYTDSPAAWDHRAFNYYAKGNLLYIPVAQNNWVTGEHFNGLMGFRIDLDEGISAVGSLDHKDLLPAEQCREVFYGPKAPPYPVLDVNGGPINVMEETSTQPSSDVDVHCYRPGEYLASPRRSLIIEEDDEAYLFSFSDLAVSVSSVQEMEGKLSSVVLWDGEMR